MNFESPIATKIINLENARNLTIAKMAAKTTYGYLYIEFKVIAIINYEDA